MILIKTSSIKTCSHARKTYTDREKKRNTNTLGSFIRDNKYKIFK